MKQRNTPRADAQRLAICYNIANRRDRNRGFRASKKGKLMFEIMK